MKLSSLSLSLPLSAAIFCMVSCATPQKSAPASGTSTTAAVDALDDYDAPEVSDPLEPVNRAIFQFNDGLYTYLLKPISKGYEFITPKPARQALDNAFDNAKFPVRFVNQGLQGKFKRAGQEAGKFAVNTVAGFGGLIRQSDHIPSLAQLPSEDTGQTFATWGIGHGPYLVLPLLGPSSIRDGVGLAGDYALNPIHWGFLLGGNSNDWSWIPGTVNTIRALPDQLAKYDESRANAVDPYLSVRSIYMQNRASVVRE